MSARECQRSWEVEAAFDDGLTPTGSASLERHLATCEACRRQRAALLRFQSLAERLPSATATPLRRRALQQRVLGNARELLLRESEPSAWRGRAAVALACAALLLLVGVVGWRISLQTTTVALAEPHFELHSAPDAQVRVVERGSTTRLSCETGKLEVSVRKLLPGQRFIINLPDGELEVRGTRFALQVQEHQTRELRVSEGRVELRLQGRPTLLVGAGEAWSPTVTAKVVAAVTPNAASSAREPAKVELATRQPSGTGPDRSDATRGDQGRAPERKAMPAPAASSSSVTDFVEAMAAYSRHDFGTAEQLLARFQQRYPDSPHQEDVLFSRAVCHSRSGDTAGAKALAEQYLRRYPHGFRAPEATRLAAHE